VRAADAGVVGEAVLLPATARQVVANGRRHLAVKLGRHTATILTPRAKRFPIRQLLFKATMLILLICPALAAAEGDRAAARSLYEQAKQHYNLGEYETALNDFLIVYREFPDPSLLHAMAQCHRKLGNRDKAILMYKSYLRESRAAGPDADEVRRLIQALEDDLRREAESKQRPPQSVEPSPTPAPAPPPPPRWATPARKAGIGLLAGGGALVLIGAGLAGSAPGLAADANRAPTFAEAQRTYDRAVSFNTAGWSLIGVGAAVAIAGTVMVALPRRRGVALHAFVSPSGVGVKGGF
jgi:tetratricopeptide (TPR) repeat protein